MNRFKRSIDGYVRERMPAEISVHADDEDEVLSIDARPSVFRVPPVGAAGPSLGADLLINKQKVSSDVLSISSRSNGSGSDSEYTTDSETDVQPRFNMMNKSPLASSRSSYSSSHDSEDDESIPDTPRNQPHDSMASRFAAERSRAESEMQEKKEILYQMDRLESKGYRLPKKFTLQSDIEEMRVEFNRVVREKEVDASIRFQRKMMMALVTGVEYLNTRFDPFDIRLDGWSEQVHDNINDYDDIFEELHDKYKGSGQKMAPELRLLMSLSGSAFMFHFTNSMFKQSNVPHVEDVLRSDPGLMKQFQQAAVNRMSASTTQAAQGPGGGLFSMFNAFTNMGPGRPPMHAAPQQQARPQQQVRMQGPRSVEDIIQDVSADVHGSSHQANRFETMSVSDEDITSIIEDTADMNGIMGGSTSKRRGGRRGPAPANAGRRTLQL